MAPRHRSSHMNQKRSWPGVPNRYRIRSVSRVMRPKSMATVVVVLPWIWVVSSTPRLAVVMAASVVRGMISQTAPTKVVLPTPKPPAMTTLTRAAAHNSTAGEPDLYCPESIEHPLEKRKVGAVADAGGPVHGDQPFLGHVAHQDTNDAKGQVEPRGDLRDGQDVPAEQGDRPPFETQGQRRLTLRGGGDQRLQLEVVVGWTGPPAGHRIGPDQPTRLLPVVLLILGAHWCFPQPCSSWQRRLQFGPEGGREHIPRAGHQQRHLVADQANITRWRG